MDAPGSGNPLSTTSRPSYWSAAVPAVCAVHCLAFPLLAVFAPALAPDPRTELLLMSITAAISVGLLIWGVRTHRKNRVWIPAIAGLALWAGALLSGSHGRIELVLEILGAVLIAAGLIWSAWLRHEALCGDCGCPAHEEPDPA
jgi:hypothetical protein